MRGTHPNSVTHVQWNPLWLPREVHCIQFPGLTLPMAEMVCMVQRDYPVIEIFKKPNYWLRETLNLIVSNSQLAKRQLG